MLELKEMTEKESRDYLNYDANLVYKYMIKIMIARMVIKQYGLQAYMGNEEIVTDKESKWLEVPIDERREIYRFMEKNSNYIEEQLAKDAFRESEYYPG